MEQSIYLSFSDQGENHIGMQKIGKKSERGFNYDDLIKTKLVMENLGASCELHRLNDALNNSVTADDAYLLIIRNGVNYMSSSENFANSLYEEQIKLIPDKKAYMKGRVCNKKARYNLMFGEEAQEPDYENKKGTIVAYRDVPYLTAFRNCLPNFIDGSSDLVSGSNYYYDPNICYILPHGDGERVKVIAVRLGIDFPLWFRWYYKCKPIGNKIKFDLSHGDVYIMSEKTVGTDWLKSSILTLRHAAGYEEVLKKVCNNF